MLLRLLPLINIAVSLISSFSVVYYWGFSTEADKYFLLTSIVTFLQNSAQSFWQGKWLVQAKHAGRENELRTEFMGWLLMLGALLLIVYYFREAFSFRPEVIGITLLWIAASIFTIVSRVLHHSQKNHLRVYKAEIFANTFLLLGFLFTVPYENTLYLIVCWLVRELLLIMQLITPMKLFGWPKYSDVTKEGYSILIISIITKPTLLIDKILLSYMSPGLLTLYSMCNSLTGVLRKYVWQSFTIPKLVHGLDKRSIKNTVLFKNLLKYSLLQLVIALFFLFFYQDKYAVLVNFKSFEIPNIVLYFVCIVLLKMLVGIVQSTLQQIFFGENKYLEILIPVGVHEAFWLLLKLIFISFSEIFFFIALLVQGITLALMLKYLVERYLN